MLIRFLTFILGGRPMTFVEYLFWDRVENRPVNLYIDAYGREWMANHRWSMFRCSHRDHRDPRY